MRKRSGNPVKYVDFLPTLASNYAEYTNGQAAEIYLFAMPCGIIRVAALCVLCRYRHNTHWTGHKSRLARNFTGQFGSKDYAAEELVAEIGAAFVGAQLGATISTTTQPISAVG
jgi:hypothetical protein